MIGVVAVGAPERARPVACAAGAGPATEALRPAVDPVMRVLADPALSGPDRKAQRQVALRPVMGRAVAPSTFRTPHAAPSQCTGRRGWRRSATSLFTDLVIDSYAVQLDGYGVDGVVFVGQSADEDVVTVHTRVESGQGTASLDYRMHRRDSRWLVYDVLVEAGASSATGAQFTTVIRTKSYAELIRRMKAHRPG